MSSVMDVKTIQDTKLWMKLNAGYRKSPEKELAQSLAANAVTLAESAIERIKAFPYYHPQYTLHDQTHLIRVCELMAIVVGDSLKSLNPIEVFLLIGAAFHHDQGMVPDADEWNSINESSDFKVSLRRWEIDNPNLAEIRRQMVDSRFSEEQRQEIRLKENELLEAHRTEYLRKSHGDRSEAIVNRLYSDSDLLAASGHNLSQILGRICVSHVWPAGQITDQAGFRVDEAVGTYTVNVRYLALILRLADILDFDQDRTPSSLLRTIHFSSPISITEWAKHRSVTGWEINPNRIRFTLQCEHPSYQRAANEFMDWIDLELAEANRIVGDFPRGVPSHYAIKLPARVDRSRIEPKNNAYRFAELEFSLSREEIVKLLMTDKLYQNDSLFIRELLQNALDALRCREALYGQGKPDWDDGVVRLEHYIDDHGFQVVRCVDNGIGMDEHIISNFLTNVGRSYYRSPEFEQQRIGFKENGVDFDPCAKFGIGFMSCFMFGDRIRIQSRRDYGPGREYGDPLVIEVNGLGGILVVRDGLNDQPVGTTIEVTGPKKPAFLDSWADRVRLCAVVEGYALATEYTIHATTTIDDIEESVTVPVTPATRRTVLDDVETEKMVLEQSFNDIDSNLGGSIRVGLLKDKNGLPTIDNGDAKFEVSESSSGSKSIQLNHRGESKSVSTHDGGKSPLCMDGILIVGVPGRSGERWGRLGCRFSSIQLGDPFVLDIRGPLKPTLTPARVPPERVGRPGDRDASWSRIQHLVDLGHARLWEKVAGYLRDGLAPATYWKLCHLHDANTHLMTAKHVWECVLVPVIDASGTLSFQKFRDIERVTFTRVDLGDEKSELRYEVEGGYVSFDKDLMDWTSHNQSQNWMLRELILRFSEATIKDEKVVFDIVPPERLKETSIERNGFGDHFEFIWDVHFANDLKEVIAAECELTIANRLNPLVQIARARYFDDEDKLNDFNSFCASVVWCLTYPENLRRILAGDVTDGRSFRRLGMLYKSLNWDEFGPEFKPPYRVWGSTNGVKEVTEDDLLRWADFPKGEHD